jgi:hypothetical protein
VGIRISIAKEVIPTPQQTFSVFFDKPLYPTDFAPAETTAIVKSDRIQPEFSSILVAFNVDMRRFITVSRIEEESIGTAS